MLFSSTLLNAGWIVMTVIYFKYIIEKRVQIKITLVIEFYLVSIIIWGAIYFKLYTIWPDSFKYINPAISYSETISKSLNNFAAALHFNLYSAFNSLTSSYYRVESNSSIVSVLVWIQSLYTLMIISFLIASYVNQKSRPKDNDNVDK